MNYSQVLLKLPRREREQLLAEAADAVLSNLKAEQTPAKPIWAPFPNSPQEMAYNSAADELFFGGGAGGGKSDLLLGLAGTRHQYSLILRREFPQVRSLIERSREIYNSARAEHAKDSYNESLHIWRLKDGAGSRQVEFGSLQYENDKRKFQGRPHDLKAWDELPQFRESMFRFVNGWNRNANPKQRCRIVGTGNPPLASEEEWVIHYWSPWLDDQHPNPAKAGELRWFAVVDGKDVEMETASPFEHKGDTLKPRSRTFVPALVSDNPFLMASGYDAVIKATPEPLRSALMGNWRAARQDDPWQVIPTEWIRNAQKRWRGCTKPTTPVTALGQDVARGGADKTVVAALYGTWFAPLVSVPGSETPTGSLAAQVAINAADDKRTVIAVDVIGIGASCYDSLRDQGFSARAVNFGGRSDATDRSGKLKMANIRAEAYWKLREALDPDFGSDLALPDDSELLSDLCAPQWKPSGGGIQIESKDDIKKRIGRSPDKGDAVTLAWLIAQTRSVLISFG